MNAIRGDFSDWRSRFLRRQASPVEYVGLLELQCQSTEPKVSALVISDWDQAKKLAAESDARYRKHELLSPIDGLPFVVKDNIETAEFPTQMQSPIFAGYQSKRNAEVVRRLIDGGAIVVGKTVTQEFACGLSGPTRNPHDITRTPGGSSSGTAAAIACQMAPFGLGTQTRASTIRPASYCGVFGFKPSFGLISVNGIHPVAPTLDTVGLFAGSLRDLSAVFQWLAPSIQITQQRTGRLLAIRTRGFEQIGENVRAELAVFLSSASSRILIDGVDSSPARAVDEMIQTADELVYDIMCFEMQWPYADYLKNFKNDLSDGIKEMVERGAQMSSHDYADLLARRDRIRAAASKVLQSYDGAITLSASGVAPRGLDHTGSRSFAIPWSLMGGPSLSLPMLVLDGLPIGVQLMTLWGRDSDCLDIANAILNIVPESQTEPRRCFLPLPFP
jgi:Asp-tRNA(Asn)/Glu-tRNA(Gln) amidotransferase A subunit family amidase